jgi:hypothetical protein
MDFAAACATTAMGRRRKEYRTDFCYFERTLPDIEAKLGF